MAEILDNQELLESQYDVIAGQWPTKYNEVVLIVDENNEEEPENNTEEKDTNEEATTEKEKVVTESIVSDYNTVSKEESVVDTKKEDTINDNKVSKEEKKEETIMNIENNKELEVHYTAGKAIDLSKVKVYATSKSHSVVNIVNGRYYIVSGKLKDGRYKISKSKSTDAKYNVGYINKEDIK